MALDFLKKPEIGAIVNQEYSDAQLSVAQKYIANYHGTDLNQDFLVNVPFDITPENREEYWEMRYAISPLSREKTIETMVTDINEELGTKTDPLSKLMFLRDGTYKWSDKVVESFAPEIDRLNRFVTEDTMHKGILGYQQDLRNRLSTAISDDEAYLDGMVPEGQHISDFQNVERNNLGSLMKISADGRIGVTTESGGWLAASNIADSLKDFSEFGAVGPEEQFIVGTKSHKIIREAISPLLERSREKLIESRARANDSAYDALKLGLVGKEEAAPIIVNKIAQGDLPIKTVIEDSLTSLLKNNKKQASEFSSTLKDVGKLVGRIGRCFNMRGDL
jgi:hypothetical protein